MTDNHKFQMEHLIMILGREEDERRRSVRRATIIAAVVVALFITVAITEGGA